MNDPMFEAEEMWMEAALAELGGVRPGVGLGERIAAGLRDVPVRRWSGRQVLVAALLVAGLAVVGGVAVWTGGDRDGGAGAAVQPDQDPEKRERKTEGKQDPEAEVIARWIRLLEAPETRVEAGRALAVLGAPAAPALEKAWREELARGREEVAAVLVETLGLVGMAETKRAFGWAVDEQIILIADYSDNRIVAVDKAGKEVWVQQEIYGAWDVELTRKGTVLVTEFSVSRVQEIDPKGKVLWEYEYLKNPYDADRLANGNTLIANTFGGSVIEVDPDGKVVWKFGEAIRPFDADRLANGNTLIADVLKDRVIEVSPDGEVVWEARPMPNAHDADRLANGNTLITLRSANKVVEVDGKGEIVWEVGNLSSPSDADRLPDGTTLVAENGVVRLFDKDGKEVWRKEMTWAVEVNRY